MNTTLDLYKRNKSCQLRKFGEQIARVGNVDNLPLYELARRDIRYNATSRWSENPSRGRGKPPATFSSSDIYHLNASSRPSIHRRPSIRFKHDKYNPPRALVHGLCIHTSLLCVTVSGEIGLLTFIKGVHTSLIQSLLFSSLYSSHGHWPRNASQALRARCVVSGGVLLVE